MSTRYLCPSCQIPILVGEHSITIDKERVRGIAMQELVDAAEDITGKDFISLADPEAVHSWCSVQVPKVKRLQKAIKAIRELEGTK